MIGFLCKDKNKINRDKVNKILDESRMITAFDTFIGIAERVLGIDLSSCYLGKPTKDLIDKIYIIILNTTLHAEVDLPFFKRI